MGDAQGGNYNIRTSGVNVVIFFSVCFLCSAGPIHKHERDCLPLMTAYAEKFAVATEIRAMHCNGKQRVMTQSVTAERKYLSQPLIQCFSLSAKSRSGGFFA